jgi:hypothetical protein
MRSPHKTANIIAFVPRQHRAGRMSEHDRRDAQSWLARSTYAHVAFEPCSDRDNPELGDFLLIYRSEATWASWGVGCAGQGLIVWDSITSETLGWFQTMRDALNAIPAASTSRKKFSRRRASIASPTDAVTTMTPPKTTFVPASPNHGRIVATQPSAGRHETAQIRHLWESV